MGPTICSKLNSFSQKCYELVVKKLLRRGRADPEDFAVAEHQKELLDPDPTESQNSVQVHSNPLDRSHLQSSSYPSNSTEPAEETPLIVSTEECAFCTPGCIIDHNINSNKTKMLQRTLFHEECPSCLSAGVPLCEFCQHLRLPHLLMCLPPDIHLNFFTIFLKSPIDILSQRDCELCEFLANALYRLVPKPARTADLSSAQLKLLFRSTTESRQLTHVHWKLLMEIDGIGGAASNDTEIRQKILRDVCAKCIVPDYGPLAESEGFIDWKIAREWLSESNSRNPPFLVAAKSSLPPGFRVIDVDSRRVVQLQDCEFVALSYVWGNRPVSPSYVVEATRDNIQALSSTGIVELPRTIEDAIRVCKHLDKKHLWVDRYCIVQDDEENKHSQISAMAEIFAASDLTIITCSGESVECGIPGVTEKRQELKRINFNGIELRHVSPTVRPVTGSVWNSRGWTYQEAILGKKSLVLTSTGAYYSSNHIIAGMGACKDNLVTELRIGPTLFADYSRHIERYTPRRLSYEDDIYDAFEGIARALYGDKDSFHFGIPEIHFDRGLLWICNGFSCSSCESCNQDDRKRSGPGLTHQISIENRQNGNSCCNKDKYLRSCRHTTPSWSWASVRWPVVFERTDNCAIPLVKWILYKHENSEIKARTIKPVDGWDGGWRGARRIEPRSYYFRLIFALAISERCVEANIRCPIPREESFQQLKRRFAERWPEYINVYDELPDISPKEGPRSDGVLFTRAQSALFCLDSHWIKDSEGRAIGHVSPDPRLHQVQTAAASQKLRMEFIGLSITTHWKIEDELCHNKPSLRSKNYWELPKEEYRDMTYLDCNGLPLLPVPAVNVMVICWEGEFAHRVAVGLIVLKEWAKAERKFKDVWLK